MRLALPALLVSSLVPLSAAWPCGGPIIKSGGQPGTALFEGPDQISAFSVTATGLSWDRLASPSWRPVHVADIPGVLDGSIETDARVDRAISSQGGALVEISAGGAVPIATASDFRVGTTVFGAALDAQLQWQVLAFEPDNKQLALFAESSPGLFVELARQSNVDCGSATMLDLVVESSGALVGICGGQAVEVSGNALQLSALPVPALALGRSSTGLAIFYGVDADGTSIAQMGHASGAFTIDATIPRLVPPAWFIATSESSVVAAEDPAGDSATAYTLSSGSWSAAELSLAGPLASAAGSPSRLIAAQYQLDIYTQQGDGSWAQGTLLAALGMPAIYGDGGGVGCASPGRADLLALGALGLTLALRRRARALA